MGNERPTYEQLRQRLTEAQQVIAALRNGEVDAVISERDVMLLRLKNVEKSLRRSEENFRSSIENSFLGIRIVSAEGELFYANQAMLDIYGYSSVEELEALPVKQRYTPESYADHQKRKEKRKRGEYVPSHYEISVVRKDGEIRHLGVFRKEVLWNGKTQFQMLYQDLTERKRMDRLLHNQHDLAVALSSTSQLKEGARLCLEAAIHISGMDCGGFYLVDKASGALDLLFHQGLSADFVKAAAHYAADSANAKLIMAGKTVHTEHLELGVPLGEAQRREGLRAIAVVPVSHGGQVIGCFNIASHALVEVPAFARDALETIVAQTSNAIARLQAEEALTESAERFRRLSEAPFEGIGFHEEGKLIDANEAFAAMFGYDLSEIIGKNVLDFATPELRELALGHIRDGSAEPYDGVAIRKDGSPLFVEVRGENIPYKGRTIRLTAVRDITERKRAEEALRESEATARALISSPVDSILLFNPDGIILDTNQTFAQRMGRRVDELIGRCVYDFFPPELAKSRRARVEEIVHFGVPIRFEDERAGMVLDHSAHPICDAQGRVTKIVVVARDITDRKEMEEALRKSEEEAMRLADEKAVIAEIGRIISSTFDIERVYELFSKEVRRIVPFDRITINIIDYQKNTFTILYTSGLNMPGRKKGRTLSLAGDPTGEVIRTKCPLHIQEDEETHRRFPSLLPVFLAGFRSFIFIPMISQDKVIGVLGLLSTQEKAYTEKELRVAERVGNQIGGAIANAGLYSELKKSEEALRESDRQAQQSAREKTILSEIARIISSSFSIEEIYRLFAEEVKKLLSFDRIILTLVSKEGNTLVNRYVEGTAALGRDPGSIFPMEGTATAEVIQGRKGFLFSAQEESEVESAYPGVLPEFRAGLRSMLSVPLISRDQPIGALHLRSRTYKGYSERDLKLAEGIANQIAGAIANAQLFNDLKDTEQAFRQSELFLRNVLEALPISVSITDKNGKVLLNNPARNKIWGGEEFKGISQLGKYKGWWADTGKKVEEDEWGLARAVKEGKTSLNRMVHIETFDGQEKTILNSGVPIRDKSGEIIGAISVNQDITELKRVESQVKKLLQSVSEKQKELRALTALLSEVEEEERRRLARELHDRVGQNLTALGINLNILRTLLQSEGEAKTGKVMEDSLRLVAETIGDIRNLMSELHPPLMDEYGLLAALRWYGKQFSERTGVAMAVRGDDRMQRLSSNEEIVLFRIAQEALTNVAKHARASQAAVTLERVSERTVLTISDDGVGFDNRGYPSQGKPDRWGFITIRERAEAIGGQVKIESEPEKGTRIIVEVGG